MVRRDYAGALTRHDDASLLALLLAGGMPADAVALVDMLRERQVHKRAIEVSARRANSTTR